MKRWGTLTGSFFIASLIVYFFTESHVAGILAAIAFVETVIVYIGYLWVMRLQKSAMKRWSGLKPSEKETFLETLPRTSKTRKVLCFGCGVDYIMEMGEMPYGWVKIDNLHYFCSECKSDSEDRRKT
jgi:hypothetical protein